MINSNQTNTRGITGEISSVSESFSKP